MPEIIPPTIGYPPQFPSLGRLPSQPILVGQHYHRQDSQERDYHNQLCLAAGRRVIPPCCKTLHISLFFDGTGNNLNHDLYIATPKHPTNITRLFQTAIGQGQAGGAGSRNADLTDIPESAGNKYFKYYAPGVGTPFPEIDDLDFSLTGLATAKRGEDRINWMLLRIIDALRRTLKLGKIEDNECIKAVQAMATSMLSFGLTGSANRYKTFQQLLKQPDLHNPLKIALNPAQPGTIKLLGIKLYIYGFSRGAAAARTFVNWLSELLPAPYGEAEKPEQCLMAGDLKIPLTVEFMGLLDTVASVGVAHIAPIAAGHMSWADGSQELPNEKTYGGWIKKCVHLVSAHEQRLCFPLESLRRTNGHYPAHSVEVVYPGVHSDLGGGYAPGDQGKASGLDDSLLLSQIALHELYAAAFAVGAPLKVPASALPEGLQQDIWRQLPPDVEGEYLIHKNLVNRFNAWRTLTLGLPLATEDISDQDAINYSPSEHSLSLETCLIEQMAWITAWRINRYAGGTYKTQTFYRDAAADGRDAHSDPVRRKADEEKRDAAQKEVEKARLDKQASLKKDEFEPLPPGVKDFDAYLDQTQLREAAIEFQEDYQGASRTRTRTQEWYVEPVYWLKDTMFMLNTDDRYPEWVKMTTAGESRLKVLFPDAGEAHNAEMPSGQTRALFDEQVHDSRAWFMHNATGAREPWGSYFLQRMVYFGKHSSKAYSPLMIAGAAVGAATLVGGVAFIIKQKNVPGNVLGAAGMMGAISLEAQAMDIITGKPLSMLPGAEKLKAFTTQPGAVVAQQRVAIAEQQFANAKEIINSTFGKKIITVIT